MRPEYMNQLGDHYSGDVQNAIGEQSQYQSNRTMSIGRITHVDPDRWTVNVDFEDTNQSQDDIPIMSPYFSQEIGQGMYIVPEVNTRVVLMYCMDTWFVAGYLPGLDYKHVDLGKEKSTTQSQNEEFKKLANGNTDKQAVEGSRVKSYRNKRESDMREGDFCLKTRGFNKSKWFTNGNILHEATKMCYRIYSKLQDEIIEFCRNFNFRTPGGNIIWTNDYKTTESDYKREVKQSTEDQYTSYLELIGHDASVYVKTVRGVERYAPAMYLEPFLPDEGDREYLPEHYQEQIGDMGYWERRVNHNFVEMNELTEGEPFTDKKSMYREIVLPTGDWDKKVEHRENGGGVFIKYNEHVQPTGHWLRKINDSNGSFTYNHSIDPTGNQTEEMFGARTTTIHKSDTLQVDNDRSVTVDQNLSTTVKNNQTVTVSSSRSISSKSEMKSAGFKMTSVGGAYILKGLPILLNTGGGGGGIGSVLTGSPLPAMVGLPGAALSGMSGALSNLTGLSAPFSAALNALPSGSFIGNASGIISNATGSSGVFLGGITGGITNAVSGLTGSLGGPLTSISSIGNQSLSSIAGLDPGTLSSKMLNISGLSVPTLQAGAISKIADAVSSGVVLPDVAGVASSLINDASVSDLTSIRDVNLQSMIGQSFDNFNVDAMVDAAVPGLSSISIDQFDINAHMGDIIDFAAGGFDVGQVHDQVSAMVADQAVNSVTEYAKSKMESV